MPKDTVTFTVKIDTDGLISDLLSMRDEGATVDEIAEYYDKHFLEYTDINKPNTKH